MRGLGFELNNLRRRGLMNGSAMPPETIVLSWDPLSKEATITLTNFNKIALSNTGGDWNVALGTVAKPSPATIGYGPWWYFEVTCWSDNIIIGICEEIENVGLIPALGYSPGQVGNSRSCGLQQNGSFLRDNGTAVATGITYGLGDVIGVAYSMNNSIARIKFYKNNVAVGTEYVAAFYTGNFRPAIAVFGIPDKYGVISNNFYPTPAGTNKLGL